MSSEPAPAAAGSAPPASAAELKAAASADREEQLAKVPFFDGLTAEALAMIAEVTTEEAAAMREQPGTVVLLLIGLRTSAVGPVLLWALASVAAGGAVGFLFGIPRAAGALRPVADVPAAANPACKIWAASWLPLRPMQRPRWRRCRGQVMCRWPRR